MKEYNRTFIVRCEIGKVWDFFADPKHVEAVSPKDFDETLISCSTPRLVRESELVVCTKLFLKKFWRSKITKFEEMHEFVDEVQNERLMKWAHIHRFEKVDDAHTRITDRVRYEFGYWPVGLIIERIVFPRLLRVFAYRENRIKEILEN